MIYEDWRDADPATLAPLYEAESRRWRAMLGWDLTASWAIVEQARRAGRVPGLVARDNRGNVGGWAFYVLHEGALQVGGLVGDSAAAVRGLLDQVLQSPEGRFARGFSCFLFPASPSLQSALERQRFLLARHFYLERPLAGADLSSPAAGSLEGSLRAFGEVDPADVVRLMARSYAGRPEARCFAPDARLDQWAHYVGQLLATPAIGRYLPSASFVIEHRDSRQVLAAIITTALSDGTAHVAQVGDDPCCRRSGLARRLVDEACVAAQRAGYSRMTLLVSEGNGPARSLYARLGFAGTAYFFYATRPALARRFAASVPRPAIAGA